MNEEEHELSEQEVAEMKQAIEAEAQIFECLKALDQIAICCKTALEGEIADADLIETLLDARMQLLEHSPDREKGSKPKEMYLEGLDKVNGKIGDIACDYLAFNIVDDEELRVLLQLSSSCGIAGICRFSELAGMVSGFDSHKAALDIQKGLGEEIKKAKKEARMEAWINKN